MEFEFILNDNETHREQLRVWMAANEMPDIYPNWVDPAALMPVIIGGYAAPLDKSSFENFLPGALEEVTVDGKLYGIPRNFDIWSVFYNQALFDEYGVEVPTTFDEMLAAGDVFKEAGIIPMALNGRDEWNQVVLLTDFLIRTTGSNELFQRAAFGETSFSEEPAALEASQMLMDLVESNFFQDGFIVDDYATAQNYFVQGQAAMYWIGTWEMGMAANEGFPTSFRENVRVMFSPSLDSPNTYGDLIGRTGMAFIANPKSENVEVAKDFIEFMFHPDRWSRWAWELGILTPAQSWAGIEGIVDNQLTRDVTVLFDEVTSISGQPMAWLLNNAYEEDVKTAINEMMSYQISQEEFWEKVDASAAANR